MDARAPRDAAQQGQDGPRGIRVLLLAPGRSQRLSGLLRRQAGIRLATRSTAWTALTTPTLLRHRARGLHGPADVDLLTAVDAATKNGWVMDPDEGHLSSSPGHFQRACRGRTANFSPSSAACWRARRRELRRVTGKPMWVLVAGQDRLRRRAQGPLRYLALTEVDMKAASPSSTQKVAWRTAWRRPFNQESQ